MHRTTRPGQATTLARDIATGGGRYIGAVGGDGTVHEVVNGLVDTAGQAVADDLVLAVITAGSGGDLARTYGLNLPVDRLVRRHLSTTDTLPMDLGVVEYRSSGKDPVAEERVFANIAQIGWGAEVVRRAARLPRVHRQTALASLGAYAAIRGVNRQEVELDLEHNSANVPLVDLVVANGQFFGGGMKVAPSGATR